MFQILSQFAFLGIPLIAVGLIGIIVAVVLVVKQRAVTEDSTFDDPSEDPAVQSLSTKGRIALWLGVIVLIVGALLMMAPAWATII